MTAEMVRKVRDRTIREKERNIKMSNINSKEGTNLCLNQVKTQNEKFL